jgi:hypothetical protein
MKDYDLVEEGFYERRALEALDEEREQQEAHRKAEAELLDGDISQREYNARRDAQPFLVVEPERDLDEMSFRDFCKARERSENPVVQPLEMGKMSYRDYLKERR